LAQAIASHLACLPFFPTTSCLSMEAALNTVLTEFGGELTERLRAVVESELTARVAELDRRERDLDARGRELAAREEALQRREADSKRKQSPVSGHGDDESKALPSVLKASPPGPTDAPTPSRASPSASLAVSALFRPQVRPEDAHTDSRTSPRASPETSALFCPPVDSEGERSEAPVSPPDTASAGAASELKNLFEKKATASPSAGPTGSALFRPPVDSDGERSEAPVSPPDTASAGAASELKSLFEKKVTAVRCDASPVQRRPSWRPASQELPSSVGGSTDKRISTGPKAPPRQRRTLEDLLKADEQHQRKD